jgi:hypothetical protein
MIDEVGHALRHPPAATARTDRAALAREWDEPLERAVPASHAGEPVGQHPAAEELPEVVDDEARKAGTNPPSSIDHSQACGYWRRLRASSPDASSFARWSMTIVHT